MMEIIIAVLCMMLMTFAYVLWLTDRLGEVINAHTKAIRELDARVKELETEEAARNVWDDEEARW